MRISKGKLEALHMFVGRNPRISMDCFKVEESSWVATDGTCLIEVFAEGREESVLLTAESLKYITKLMDKRKKSDRNDAVLEVDPNGFVKATVGRLETKIPECTRFFAVFAPYEKLWPKDQPETGFTISPKNLDRISKAAKAMDADAVDFEFHGPREALAFKIKRKGDVLARGLSMGMVERDTDFP